MAISETSSNRNVPAVQGQNTAGGDGVVGTGRRGVVGHSETFQGVFGKSRDNAGIVGESDRMHAGFFITHFASAAGVASFNDAGGTGVYGESLGGTGIVGKGRFAGQFFGKVRVQGDLAVTGDVILATATFARGQEYEITKPEGKVMSSEAEVNSSIDLEIAEINSSVEMPAESTVAEISLAQKLAEIDNRTKRIENILTTLFRATARVPDGRTLNAVVGAIEAKVNRL